MGLARIVLAILPIVGPSLTAGAQPHEAGLANRIDVIPMAWRVERQTDAGSGGRRCFLISWGGDVTVRRHKPSPAEAATWSVMVGFDNQPGSVRYLRINRKYFTTAEQGFHGSEADDIVQLLKSPGEFAFEWAKWPDHAKRQGLFGTGDFAAKAAECERWVDRRQSAHVTPRARREIWFAHYAALGGRVDFDRCTTESRTESAGARTRRFDPEQTLSSPSEIERWPVSSLCKHSTGSGVPVQCHGGDTLPP